MVQYSAAAFDETFHALADPTRRAIVDRLSRGEATLGELARPFDMSLTAVQKHLRVLEDAGLVRSAKRGRTRHCRLDARPLSRAVKWMDSRRRLWERRLDALERQL